MITARRLSVRDISNSDVEVMCTLPAQFLRLIHAHS